MSMPAIATKPAIYAERSVQLPDLNEKGIWLVGLLKERFSSNEGELVNWLRSVIVTPGNSFMFVRTDHAFALAQSSREPLSSRCIVCEQFVVNEEGYEDEGAYLYHVLYQWAKNLNAYEMRIENLTTVPREMIKERIGELFKRETIYCQFDG